MIYLRLKQIKKTFGGIKMLSEKYPINKSKKLVGVTKNKDYKGLPKRTKEEKEQLAKNYEKSDFVDSWIK